MGAEKKKPRSAGIEDTITAISTPAGAGALGIVRLSGPQALKISNKIFTSNSCPNICAAQSHTVHYGHIHSGNTILDEVLLIVLKAPHTYTKEDMVEISGHGGIFSLRKILDEAMKEGARLAEPGEFTRRAFLNGRIDLSQAESVIDVINAETDAGLTLAVNQLKGALSQKVQGIIAGIMDVYAPLEAAIDFPEEEIVGVSEKALRGRILKARTDIDGLIRTKDDGRRVRQGINLVIAGRANAGKSSLFNALLRDARAIVTEHAGTTRDLIEEVITINGIPVRLTDTAGLRDTANEIERLGIAAAREALRNAHAMLLVVDAARPAPEDAALLDELAAFEAPIVLAMNKRDLAPDAPAPAWATRCRDVVRVSALRGDGLTELEDALGRLLLGGEAPEGHEAMLTQAHQRDSLRRAAEAVDRLLAQPNASPEFLSIDLRDAIDALGEITGETTPDDVLGRVFSSFCIGK